MKMITFTYSNGDIEKCVYKGSDYDEAIRNLVKDSFKCAWFRQDEDGNIVAITNMNFVRSVEIEDEEACDNLEN